MLTLFCGEDTSQSRTAYIAFKNELTAKNYEVTPINDPDQLNTIIFGSSSLFSELKAFSVDFELTKKKNRDILKPFYEGDEQVFAWANGISGKDTKRYFPKAIIRAFDFPSTIWKLIDSLAPGNKKLVITLTHELIDRIDPHMILYMLTRRTKELLLISAGSQPAGMQGWQVGKLSSQAKQWDQSRLQLMYAKLSSIDQQIKTGASVFSAPQLLDLMYSFIL